MTDKNNFDYLGYANASGVQLQEDDLQNESIRSALYADAVNTSIEALKKERLLSEKQAILETETLLSDTRQVLGLPRLRTEEEQRASLFAPAYKQYIRNNRLHELNPEADIDFFVKGYIKQLSDNEWANPNIAARPAEENQGILKSQLEKIDSFTLKEWIESEPQLDELPLNKVEGPVKRTEEENQGLFGRVSKAFTRSIYANDVQNAVDAMINIEDTYMVDADSGGLVLEEVTLEGTTPVVNNVKVINKTPEEILQERDTAIKQFVTAIVQRDKTPLDKGLEKIMRSEDVPTAFSNFVKDPASMAVILAEQGVDFFQEGATQVGATAVGSLFTTPTGGVVIGSGAMSAVVRDNVYNSFLSQEIEKYIAENKLELNEANVKKFLDDEEKLKEAKDKANISSSIIMGGAFASGLVGGGVGLSSVAKLATRLGLRPVVKQGEIVFEQVAKQSLGSLAAAGAASTVIDVAADSTSKIAIGEEINPGELVLTVATGVAGAAVDVSSGAVARMGRAVDKPLQIRVGDTLVDSAGNEVIVKSGIGGKVKVVGEVTENVEGFGETRTVQEFEINGSDLIKKYQVKPESTLAPEGFEDHYTESTVLNNAALNIRNRTPLAETKYDITKPIGLEFEVSAANTDADFGANWFNYHIKRVAAATGLNAPSDYVRPDGEKIDNSPLALGFKGETDLQDALTTVGKSLRRLVNDETDTKSADRALIEEIQKRGLITQDVFGKYIPAYDETVVASADDIQLKSWFAAIANSANSDLALPNKKPKPEAVSSDEASPVLNTDQPIVSESSQYLDQILISRAQLESRINDLRNASEDIETSGTTDSGNSSVEASKIEELLENSQQEFFSRFDINEVLPSTPKQELIDAAIETSAKDRLNESRNEGTSEQVLYGLIRARDIARQIDTEQFNTSEKENFDSKLRQLDEGISEVQDYLGVEIDETPSSTTVIDENNSNIKISTREFFTQVNESLKSPERVLAQTEDVTSSINTDGMDSNENVLPSVAGGSSDRTVPLSPFPDKGLIVNKVVPVIKRPVSVSFADIPGNFIPSSKIAAIQDAGYAVDVHQDKKNNIFALTVIDNEVPNRHLVVMTTGKSSNPASNKDRNVKVYLGGTVKGRKVVGGKELKSEGGNKHFTIPAETTIIEAGDNFIDSLEQAAFNNGLEVRQESGQGIAERSVYTKAPNPIERVAVFSHDGNRIYVNDQPQDAPVGLSKQSVTVTDRVNETLAQLNSELLAEVNFTNSPKPKNLGLNEKKNQQLQNIAEVMDTDYRVTRVTKDGQSYVDTGGIPLLIDTRRGDVNEIMAQVVMDTTRYDSLIFDGDRAAGNKNFTMRDIQPYVDALPSHIRNIIVLHENSDNPASMMGALGFFAPDYQGNGPAIHIDIRPTVQSFEGVISTLSEEVAHFSFNSWTTGSAITPMQKFYAKAFELYKTEINTSLQAYINNPKRPIDLDNPDSVDQFILVNELFSKQGTSIVDFVDNKAIPPAGLSREEIDALRQQGREDIDHFTFKMSDIEKLSPENKEGVKEFAKSILRAQASGVIGKRVVFDYEMGSNRLRIVPTVVGQARSTIPNTSRAKKAARARSVSGRKDFLGSLRKFYEQNKLSENGISLREVQRIITANTAIAESRANKRFRSHLILAKKANAIMRKKGVDRITDDTYVDGYVNAFRNVGATSKRELKIAAEADQYLSTAFNVAVEQHQLIKREIAEHIRLIERLSRDGVDGTPALMDKTVASKAINELERNAQRYKVNWNHIRYNAYENPKDQEFFNEAIQQFDPESNYKGETFAQQKDKAEAEIRRIEASSMSDKEVAIAAQEQIINKYRRIVHLEEYFRRRDGKRVDGSTQYQREIVNFLRSLQDDTRQYQGNGFGKLSQISANRVRKLDQNAGENTSDWSLIQFLDPITDPLEVAVYNVHQRHEILSKLKANRRLTETLLYHGQAYPVGSSGSTTASGKVAILEGQQGSVLDYIQVDAVVAEDIRDQINIQRTIDGGIVSHAVGLAKQMATVFNIPLALTNYLGVPFMMTLNGDIFYFSKWMTPSGGIRAAWKQRVESEGGTGGYTQQLINEAVENDLFGLGTQAGTLEVINKNDILEKSFTKATALLNKLNLLAEDRKIGVDEKFTKVIDFLRDFYIFSDDVPKVISYIINKERALSKWETKLNKEDYSSINHWKDAVNANAVREAVDRTKRITTDWGVMPRALKSIIYGNKRWIFTDFLTHNVQMAKIFSENFNLYGEDYADLKEARAIGAKDWERSIRNTMFARVAGNGIITAGLGYGTITGFSLMGVAVNNLLEFVNEELMGMDYEDDENLLDSVQREGLTELMKYLSYNGAIMYEPLPYRDNEGNVYFVNWNRMNPAGALYAPPPSSEEVEVLDQGLSFMKNIFLAGDNGTMINRMFDAVRGIDWKGDRVKSNGEYTINAVSTISDLYTPGTVKKAYELINQHNWYGTQVVPVEVGAANMLGAGMKYFKPEDVMRKIGKQMQGDVINSGISEILVNGISEGNGSVPRVAIVTMLKFEKSQTEKLMRRYNNALDAGSKYGWSGKQMQTLLSEEKSDLSKDRAKRFLSGKNIFLEQTGTKLKNKLKAIRDKPVNSVTFPKEWKDRAISDLEFAIDQYELLLKPGG